MTWWLLTFSRGGPARYLSHLDTTRALQRTFARAGIRIALSQGMRPKPCIALPLPLPVGAAGCQEVAVIEVAADGPEPAVALASLRAAAPPGLEPTAIAIAGERHPRPQPRRAEYTCVVQGDAGALAAAVERYASEDHVIYERVSPKGKRTLDLKEYVVGTSAQVVTGGAKLGFAVRYGAAGAARPQDYVDLIAEWAGVEPVMRSLERMRINWEDLPRTEVAAAEGVDPSENPEEGDDRRRVAGVGPRRPR